MHELGVVMQVVDVVEKFARENQVEKIDTVVLQIGELSSMIPKYVEEVYPAAADGTMLEGSRLRGEIMPANGRCNQWCSPWWNMRENVPSVRAATAICSAAGNFILRKLCVIEKSCRFNDEKS